MSDKPVLMIGASGAVGRPTIQHLVARGVRIRALTSNEASASRLREAGVAETVVGDVRQEADVARALTGVDRLLFNAPRFIEDEAVIGGTVIRLAKAHGIERFVLNSVLHPELSGLPHHANKLRVQEALLDSGLDYVILQPAMFMQNLLVEWPRITREGVYARPYSPHRRMALIDTHDLGEAVAIVLTRPEYVGGTFELCGPSPLTHAEMASVLSEKLRKRIDAVHRDASDWQAWATRTGWTPWAIQTYLAMCNHYDKHGYCGGNSVVLRVILDRSPGDFTDFVQRIVMSVG